MRRRNNSLPILMGKLTGEKVVFINSFLPFQLVCRTRKGMNPSDYEVDAKKLKEILCMYLPYGTLTILRKLINKEFGENE